MATIKKPIKKAQFGDQIDYTKANSTTYVGNKKNWKRVNSFNLPDASNKEEVIKTKVKKNGNVKTKSISSTLRPDGNKFEGGVTKTVTSPKGDTISSNTRSINDDRAYKREVKKVNSLDSKQVSETQLKKGGSIKKKMKSGGKVMLKRADGSTSQRGLWDNIRAAKGSGKKPTAQMLKQEKKIKSQTKKK